MVASRRVEAIAQLQRGELTLVDPATHQARLVKVSAQAQQKLWDLMSLELPPAGPTGSSD